VGQALIKHLRETVPGVKIMGVDIQKENNGAAKADVFVKKDVRNRGISVCITDFFPDTVIHLAFVVDPQHDEKTMHDINVGGTANLLDTLSNLPTPPTRLLVASSAVVYGARNTNPETMDEDHPISKKERFSYAAHKVKLEELVTNFAKNHTNMHVSWIRPAVIMGAGMSNWTTRTLTWKLRPRISGIDLPIQLVHEHDVVSAIVTILQHDGRGPYNVAPPDTVKLSTVGKETGGRMIYIPYWLLYLVVAIGWYFRLLEFPPCVLPFFVHPWIIRPKRLQNELDFQFKYSSDDTLRDYLKQTKRS